MAKISVYNLKNEKVRDIELDDSVFGVPVREHLYYEVVKMRQANKRSGNAHTKTRGEVAFSTAKLFRQKGTGNARRGSKRAPILKGGGTTFGPRKRSYAYRVPRSMRLAALKSALSGRLQEKRFFVVDNFELSEIKTKGVLEVFKRFEVDNALVIDGAGNENLKKSTRNLPSFKFLATEGINVYDILHYDNFVVTEESVRAIEGALKR
jgi:large subunit ribosomal protein L4